ncbi:hypothetical protein ATJ97_0506 [Georgenia soli]|uniref:Uncharacterized protein n=1 Tax=Georgenia soli TaxID=638953 RepID=A0A2A9EGI8_9MICO|nr:hypothetical protein [Georgenia soli]PFG38038.1 hypothetical protein ATJ97_0506 [Georgenia soli]
MDVHGDDQLPFGLRPGINHNPMQPSFRDGTSSTPRRLRPILMSILVGLVAIVGLVAYGVLA